MPIAPQIYLCTEHSPTTHGYISTASRRGFHSTSQTPRGIIHQNKLSKKFLTAMARLLILSAVCLFLGIAAVGNSYLLRGKVYCDTCRVGYETTASPYLPGCIVNLVCKKRDDTNVITYTATAVTGSTGEYRIQVDRDCGDDICDVVLGKSSVPECSTPNGGRDKARVILTNDNGMVSDTRYANNLGYLLNTPLDKCPKILQQYQEADDSV